MSPMDIEKMLAELRAEKQLIDEAIMAMERLASGRGPRRGRPPKWMSDAKERGGAAKTVGAAEEDGTDDL